MNERKKKQRRLITTINKTNVRHKSAQKVLDVGNDTMIGRSRPFANAKIPDYYLFFALLCSCYNWNLPSQCKFCSSVHYYHITNEAIILYFNGLPHRNTPIRPVNEQNALKNVKQQQKTKNSSHQIITRIIKSINSHV